MKIINGFPRLVSKPKYGFYLVTAIHSDGTTHSKGYTANSSTEAKYRYLVEFGKVRGEIQTKFLQTLDAIPKLCYNKVSSQGGQDNEN